MNAKLPYEKHVFTNGLRLILVPMNGVNSVATSVMVGVGSRYETSSINGVSHFLEHMVFKGTKKYPTTDDVNIIERAGGLQNAYTDIDITNYHNKVLSTDWELALDINKELATKPLLEQKHIDKERDVILEEMKRYEDEPSAKVGEAFHSMMYPKTSLGRRIIGEVESLKAADANTLRAYHDQWYTPGKMVVVLAGDLRGNTTNTTNNTNTTNRILEKTEKWFGSLGNPGEVSTLEKIKENQTKPQLSVVTKPDAQQAHITIGIRTFARNSDDRFAWNLFNLIMGVSFTSRLFKEVREKRGLCYHIRSGADAWQDVGYWSIYAGVATDKVTQTTQAILAELEKVKDTGVTEDELKVARKRLKTMLAFKSEDPEFLNEYYGRQELYGDPVLTLTDYIKKIETVTKEDINRLARKYLVTKTLNMAVVWNRTRQEKLEKLLKV
ncbi:insulinase family protein [Candidatus Gottesmanbacteria bacterium]|nr:insulinase family protein [Candidatus Gottesmanbacteria bacterium]